MMIGDITSETRKGGVYFLLHIGIGFSVPARKYYCLEEKLALEV
jgi:hypothetical protein